MNPRDTSASVQRPMKRPLWDTSASEMTGAILTVKTMRIAEAAQALRYVSDALESFFSILQQARGEECRDSDFPSQRHVETPQARCWKKQNDDIRAHVERTLCNDDVVHIVTLRVWRELVPYSFPRIAVEHGPEHQDRV